MATGLISLIKQAALEAVENTQVCDLRFGEVVSVSPLKVKVTNQLTIPSALLIVPEHLTNYEVNVNINWETESEADHTHMIGETKTMVIHGELKIGDRVALLRKQGGQSYFILDRI